jgi:hypothetical protein
MLASANEGRDDPDLWARGCAQAQAIVREVNEQIHQLGRPRDPNAGEYGIVCECADSECLRALSVPASVYQDARRFPTRFIVVDGHQVDELERIVEQGNGYTVVEKLGTGASTAIRLDPRRRHGIQL